MGLVVCLARAYVACAPGLPAVDEGRLTAHADAFRARLPLRMRIALRLVLAVFAAWAFLAGGLRAFAKQPLERQARLYERFTGGRGYLRALLTQLLHLAFLGSLYAQPEVQRAIGYVKAGAR